MKKYGKYEKMADGTRAKQPAVKDVLLQTYFTSLLCLVLCVTMFFGTSYAWFTSEVTNEGNEIYIGVLDVDLQMDGESLNNSETKVYENSIRWEPGYTALRTLTVVNKGDLAFNYMLNFTNGKPEDEDVDLERLAECFEVWVYSGSYSKTEDETFAKMTAKEGWTRVGTLGEVLAGKAVFSGSMTAEDVNAVNNAGEKTTHTYTIALHMNENVTNTSETNLMGKSISLNVKLVAYQMASEQDGLGENYDQFNGVTTVEQLQKALDDATGETTIVLADDITGDVTVTQKENVKITIDGNGKTFSGIITVDGKSARYETAALTIQDMTFSGVTCPDDKEYPDAYIRLGHVDAARYTNNVTVKNCTFRCTDNTMVAVKSYTGGDMNLTIDGCTVGEGMHSLLQVTNVEKGLKITNCEVKSKNGVNLNNTLNLEMSDCTFDVKGYAVRFGVSTGGNLGEEKNYVIKDSTLKAACEDDDAVIIFRASAVDAVLTLTNTTVEGTLKVKGNTDATIIIGLN